MKPGTKGFIAATAFGLVHAGIIATGASVIAAESNGTKTAASNSAAAPAAVAAAKPATVAAAPQAVPAQPAASAPSTARAVDERRFALTFLTELANGERETAYGKLARETRDATTLKAFERAFTPVSTLGLKQVTWNRITERRGVTSYTPATGYTKSPAITGLEGTATSDSGPIRVEFTLIESPDGWKIQHFRFKTERRAAR